MRNHKQDPWPSEFYKNTSYNYPWYTHLLPERPKLRNRIRKKQMTVSSLQALMMFQACAIISSHAGECSMTEPDDDMDRYIDFLEAINPADWGNDEGLMESVHRVFHRKKEAESR